MNATLLLMLMGAGPTLAIVDVDAPDSMLSLGGLLTRSVVLEAQAQKLPAMGPDQVKQSLDPQRYQQLRKCLGQVACVAQHLGGLGFTRAVVGQLTRDEKNYVVRLWLIDLVHLKVIADVDRSILIAGRRLQKELDQAIPPLLRGEPEARGTLTVTSNVRDAQVTLNGELVGFPPLSLKLRPGKYELKLERNKYLPVTRLWDVEANQDTKAQVNLLLLPGQLADDPSLVVSSSQSLKPAPSGAGLSALTWILGGAAVVAGGTAVGFGVVARNEARVLSGGYDPVTSVYQGTRAQALLQNQHAWVANISFMVAGSALVGAIISGVVDATRPVQVAAAVSPSGASVGLRGTF